MPIPAAVLAVLPLIVEGVGTLARGLDWLLGGFGVSPTNPARRTSSTLANLSGLAALMETGEKLTGHEWSAPAYPGWDTLATTAGVMLPATGALSGAGRVTGKAVAQTGAQLTAKEAAAGVRAASPMVAKTGAKLAANATPTGVSKATTILPKGAPFPLPPPVQIRARPLSIGERVLQSAAEMPPPTPVASSQLRDYLYKANELAKHPAVLTVKPYFISSHPTTPYPPPPPSPEQVLIQQLLQTYEPTSPTMLDIGFGNSFPGFPPPPPPVDMENMPIENAW